MFPIWDLMIGINARRTPIRSSRAVVGEKRPPPSTYPTPRAPSTMPIGLRCTRPRRSTARVKLSTEPETADPNARASSTILLACSKASPAGFSPSLPKPWYSVLMATLGPSCRASARGDLSDDVPERQRSREACDGPLADEVGHLLDGLIDRHLGLLHDLLCVLAA